MYCEKLVAEKFSVGKKLDFFLNKSEMNIFQSLEFGTVEHNDSVWRKRVVI